MKRTMYISRFGILCLFVLLSVLLTGCSSKVIKKNILSDDGQVIGAQLFQKNVLIGEEYYDENGAVIREITFNADGQATEEKGYDASGVLQNHTAYTYEGGELKQSDQSIYNESGEMTFQIVKDYSNGELSTQTQTSWKDGKTVSETVTKYQRGEDGSLTTEVKTDGKLISQKAEDAEGSPLWEREYADTGVSVKKIYQNGVCHISESYNKDGEQTQYSLYQYDEAGNYTRQDVYNTEDVLLFYSIYSYENGRRTQTDMYYPDGSLMRKAVYDAEGNVTLYDANGDLMK